MRMRMDSERHASVRRVRTVEDQSDHVALKAQIGLMRAHSSRHTISVVNMCNHYVSICSFDVVVPRSERDLSIGF